jgi:hypothetical protein
MREDIVTVEVVAVVEEAVEVIMEVSLETRVMVVTEVATEAVAVEEAVEVIMEVLETRVITVMEDAVMEATDQEDTVDTVTMMITRAADQEVMEATRVTVETPTMIIWAMAMVTEAMTTLVTMRALAMRALAMRALAMRVPEATVAARWVAMADMTTTMISNTARMMRVVTVMWRTLERRPMEMRRTTISRLVLRQQPRAREAVQPPAK